MNDYSVIATTHNLPDNFAKTLEILTGIFSAVQDFSVHTG